MQDLISKILNQSRRWPPYTINQMISCSQAKSKWLVLWTEVSAQSLDHVEVTMESYMS